MSKNRNIEFNLEDAKDTEKELILNGTIKDRLNALALLCIRNSSETNYKQLLSFCENQRNDVIYMTLKLIRDLIKEEKTKIEQNAKKAKSKEKESTSILDNYYIKGRIIKCFEMGAKNQYIKDKTVEIIGVLIRSGIFEEELIDILISRLIEKGKTLSLVENALKSVFQIYEEQMYHGFEDFYFKNDNFRNQYGLLKFLSTLDILSSKMVNNFFEFYNSALSNLDDYPQDQKDLMIELLVNGLSSTITSDPDKSYTINKIDLIRKYVKTPISIISCLNLLIKTKDPYVESYILRVSRTSILRSTKYEPEFLNIIMKIESGILFAKLINNSFHCTVSYVLAVMMLGSSKNIDFKELYSLCLFEKHYDPLIRDMALKLKNGEKIQTFDPFDKIYLDGLVRTLQKKEQYIK